MIEKNLKGFALAVSMLSILPFFKVHNFYKGINGYAVMYYPFVGFLLGIFLYFIHTFFDSDLVHNHLGIVIFTLWVLLTGALHLDGFSDTVDGLFVDKQRALEVMKDPHSGGMGMIFSVVFLILKASSIYMLDDFYMVAVIMALARFNAVSAIYLFPYIHKNGMGRLAKDELKGFHVFVAFLFIFYIASISLIFVSLLVLCFVSVLFVKRYGGFSGDIYGFLIEVSEVVLLNFIIFGAI